MSSFTNLCMFTQVYVWLLSFLIAIYFRYRPDYSYSCRFCALYRLLCYHCFIYRFNTLLFHCWRYIVRSMVSCSDFSVKELMQWVQWLGNIYLMNVANLCVYIPSTTSTLCVESLNMYTQLMFTWVISYSIFIVMDLFSTVIRICFLIRGFIPLTKEPSQI